MKCFRCKKEIDPESNYYAIKEVDKRNTINVDFVHRECWDRFTSSLNGATQSLKKSNYLLNAMGEHMKKIGIIKEEPEVVTI